MLEVFYPNEYLESSYVIDYEWLAAAGFLGVIFDIDNTLVPHGAPADERAVALFDRIHAAGLRTCLISNNQAPRVAPFAEAVGAEYICPAGKPSKKGYLAACRDMGIDRSEAVFVGDQLFTDIWGANMAGIRSILVRPIHPKEEIQIVFKRFLEKPILWWYERHGYRRVERIFPKKHRKKY